MYVAYIEKNSDILLLLYLLLIYGKIKEKKERCAGKNNYIDFNMLYKLFTHINTHSFEFLEDF